MTTPVSSSNSSFYDPTAQFTPAETPPGLVCEPPPEVTIPPVVISGDAGAQRLIQEHDAARSAPSCSSEAMSASLSCAKAGLAAAAGVLMSSTLVGAAVGFGMTVAESTSCGKDLRAYSDCKSE